ncbi:MAG: AAA family ATPase [Chloroflexota bacterium]
MHLKHLTLQGYKSFADKTEFEFPRGITAIVGPNGTGKSNIADAIRWALGERSMSTLRAKSSADMIFMGGDGRARAGMSEVSLTFDNSDGGLPIDFSEVTISRRAYRSGENEYLINGSQVLLRDVEELLAGSSLSERTYTVIGQGLVDVALSLSPQERRALFEEAAGVTLYRARREKTVQRLDETERNLERVHDIIGEVTPRLRRLEREAHQVEQHRRLAAHLERLQHTWYGFRWGQGQAELDRALKRAASLEQKLTGRRAETSRLNERLSQVRKREGELRASLRDWYRESADLHEHVDQARRELAVSEERERLLKARREELLDEIEPLIIQREQQMEQVDQLKRRVEELTDQLAERRERLSEMEQQAQARAARAETAERERIEAEQDLRRYRQRLESLDRELLEVRDEISGLVSEQAVAEERARQLERRCEEAVAAIEPLREEEHQQSQQVARSRARLEELEQVLAERELALAALEEAWHAFRERPLDRDEEFHRVLEVVRGKRDEIERLDRALHDQREEEAALAGELRALEQVHATGVAYGSGVQVLLKANLDGVLGPLAGMIEVPSAWERAVAAALGSDLRAVLVDNRTTVERAHRILEAEGGRLTLLALDELRPPPPGDRLPGDAVWAADVVACSDRVRAAVDTLLGAVALCDDLKEALVLQSEMAPGGCCVTRTGIVLRADGAFVVGRTDDGGVLANQRARRELSERLDQVRRHLTDLGERREAEGEQLVSAEARLAEIDRQIAQAREEKRRRYQDDLGEARTGVAVARETLRSERSALEREESELARLRSRRERLFNQARELEARYNTEVERAEALQFAVSQIEPAGETPTAEIAEPFQERFQEAQRRRGAVEKEQHAVSQRVTSLQERLEELTERAVRAREEAAHFERETLSQVRTALAVTEASLENEMQTLERESALLERLGSQVEARRGRAEELKAERETLQGRVEDLRGKASRLERQLHNVRVRVQPAEEELEELNAQQTSLEKQRRRAQELVRGAEERYGRSQLEVERKRDELRLLAERIDEDLGLVELELGESVTAQAPLPMRPLVSELPVVEQLPEGLEREMQFLKKRLRHIGAVNPNAPGELGEVRGRHSFLTEQAADLEAATAQLRRSVTELDALMEKAFRETFDAVAQRFSAMFSRLFDGGEAQLALTDPDDLLNTGVDIVARPPGKRAQRLALLSGGERALTATALLFSLLQVSPTPFCVLDEVDAMLDETNVGRFRAKLEELSQETQFVVITHNRSTVESAETVYGVSMGSNAVSQVVSLKMDEAKTGR